MFCRGTPKSARKILLPSMRSSALSPVASPLRHGGSGDAQGPEESSAWISAKYYRMRMNEARLDSDDNDGDTIDETPMNYMPLSCPPLSFREGRRLLKAPKLDFTMLDDDKDQKEEEQPKEPEAAPEAAPEAPPTPKTRGAAVRRPMRMTRSRLVSFITFLVLI